MVDLSVASDGELGDGVFFSDLFAEAVRSKFTGGFRVRAPQDMTLFFRDGVPIHAGGAGFSRHHLGDVLLREGAIDEGLLKAALERQAEAGGLLGRTLEALGVEARVVERGVEKQIEARTLELFGAIGPWQSAPGENDRVKEMAVPCSAEGLILRGLRGHASDEELRATSDALLGRAVSLIGALPDLPFDETELKVARYLDRPRKPDQLERAVSRRVVRVMLRVLMMQEKLKISAASQAIPIAKATRVVAPTTGDPSGTMGGGQTSSTEQPEEIVIVVPPPEKKPAPKPQAKENELMAEVKALHKELKNKSYFELLGVKPETPAGDVRKAFTTLAKKFHPDAFVGPTDEEFARIVREVSARLNEAYQTLSNEKARAEYVALLGNSHIRGDAQKAELIRDSEMKYQKGLVLLRRKDFAGAREYLTQAVAGYPESGPMKAALAWSIFADVKYDRKEAIAKAHALLTEALAMERPSAVTFFYMGEVSKAREDFDAALKNFEKAHRLDPKLVDAERELRLLRTRNQKGSGGEKGRGEKDGGEKDGPGGLLNRFLKR